MSAQTQAKGADRFSGRSPIRFEFVHSTAKRVCVGGSFNGWNPAATPLAPWGRGRWLRELWLPPGRHEYLFVVDGEFDPRATDYAPNVFGGRNLVVEVHRPAVAPPRLRHIVPVGISGLIGLLVTGLFWAGCAASRSYSGPVHGLTFNGTVQSIDLQHHGLTVVPLRQSEPRVFLWESSTKFWKNGVPVRPDSVETGQSTRVHYHVTPSGPVAHHVYLQVPYAPLH